MTLHKGPPPPSPVREPIAEPLGAGQPDVDPQHLSAMIDAALLALEDPANARQTALERAPRVRMAGIPIAVATEAEVVASILGALRRGVGGWVATPNVDHLRRIAQDERTRALARQADIAIADGMPLIWFSRLAGRALPERVAGSSLVWTLAGASSITGFSTFLLGGEPGVADRAGQVLSAEFPGLRVVGSCCPPYGFETDDAELEAIREQLRAAQPDIVFVALGFPKQEQLISLMRSELPSSWFLGIGAGLDFVAGQRSRAPKWMQRSGLEWLHRLLLEPRRLFRRYVLQDIPFVVPMLLRAALVGLRRRIAPAR